MTRKIIIVENRAGYTREEKSLFGMTTTEGQVSHIFINAKKNRAGAELIDTLFHELRHAAAGLYKTRLNAKREEKLARLVGNIVRDAFKGA